MSGCQNDKGPQGLRADLVDERHESISSEASFQLLVEGVQDYAIFILDPAGPWPKRASSRAAVSSAISL